MGRWPDDFRLQAEILMVNQLTAVFDGWKIFFSVLLRLLFNWQLIFNNILVSSFAAKRMKNKIRECIVRRHY